jgi:hypothetical protein
LPCFQSYVISMLPQQTPFISSVHHLGSDIPQT